MYHTGIVTFVSNTSFVSHSVFPIYFGQENCNLSERNCRTMVVLSFHYFLYQIISSLFSISINNVLYEIFEHGLECKQTIKTAKMHFFLAYFVQINMIGYFYR